MTSGALPILTYHAIDDSGAVISTPRARFIETLDALQNAGFRAICLERWIAQGRPPVDRAFALAFDDGLASILSVADETHRRSIPATIFLVSGRIGSDNAWPGQPIDVPRSRLLSRGELKSLDHLGFTFGSHSVSHASLDQLSPIAMRTELVESRDAIEQVFGRPCRLLAYPYGASNAQVRDLAGEIYEAAFGTRLAYANGLDDRSDIARIDAYYLKSGGSIARLADGRWHRRLAIRRVLRTVRTSVAEMSRSHA